MSFECKAECKAECKTSIVFDNLPDYIAEDIIAFINEEKYNIYKPAKPTFVCPKSNVTESNRTESIINEVKHIVGIPEKHWNTHMLRVCAKYLSPELNEVERC